MLCRDMITPTVDELLKPSERNLPCIFKDCQRTFRHRPALNMHLTQTHNLKGYGDFRKKKKQLYLCPVAGCLRSFPDNPFTSMATVRNHYANMHAERNLVCTNCGKTMSTEKQFNLHMKSCGKVFVCKFCNVPYASVEGVARHQMSVHTAAYQHAKSANVHHSCYTIEDGKEKQSSATPGAHLGEQRDQTGPEEDLNKASAPLSIRSQNKQKNLTHQYMGSIRGALAQSTLMAGKPSGSITNKLTVAQFGASPSPVKGSQRLDDRSNRVNRVRYTPLLPKPTTPTCRILKIGSGDVKETSTQTDLLGAAVGYSNITLEDQCTNTTITAECQLTKTFTTTQSQCTMLSEYPQNNQFSSMEPLYVNQLDCQESQQWTTGVSERPVTDPLPQSQHTVPADFSTQTSFADVPITPLNTNFGTQTALSSLFDVVGGSSSSIELQCDLGNEPLQSTLPLEEAMSFGTQTNLSHESQTFSPAACMTSTEVSSFGTQTAADCNELPELVMPDSFPLQQSTSDFSMQFPYDLMDFGTQTPLLDSANQGSGTFTFDEFFNDHSTDSPAQLSQSATQTDLEFLFNNIETQTDWCQGSRVTSSVSDHLF